MTQTKAENSRLSLYAVGMSLSALLAITFVICVVWGLLFPSLEMHPGWAMFFPWFEWISWPSFFIGLAESYIYGWYFAVVFVLLYNFFKSKRK